MAGGVGIDLLEIERLERDAQARGAVGDVQRRDHRGEHDGGRGGHERPDHDQTNP